MAALSEPQFVEVQHQATGNIEQPDDRVKTRSHDRGAPFLMDGDFLKVTNREATKTHVFAWNRKTYVLEPGESKFVPFEAIVDVMGDPGSMESEVQRYSDGQGGHGIVMQRSFEMERLFARYAVLGSHLDDKRRRRANSYSVCCPRPHASRWRPSTASTSRSQGPTPT